MIRTLRRSLLATALVISPGAQAAGEVTVYKNPHCGCCGKWVEHLRENGFQVTSRDVVDLTEIKARYGVRPRLASCHTAVVDGYVLEGHVPAEAVKRLLQERPPVKGLAVPGMPVGSPGMEGPDPQPYNVYTFDDKGEAQVYMRY
ncbi:MAG: metal-binding protein [Burkholderiales bacterium]|nr:MAG: metal-binding protein [Burkholderiales bacterium]